MGRRVFINLLAIAELIDGRNLAGLVDGRLILHMHLCPCFVLDGEVEGPQPIVDANDGSNAHASLVTEQVYPLRVLLKAVEALHGAFELCELHRKFGRNVDASGLILGYSGIDQ